MRKRLILTSTVLAMVTAMTLPASARSAVVVGSSDTAPQHVFLIMMENHGFSQVIGNTADAPFTNQLAAANSVATNYYGVTHPSLPNYLAAISGDFQGIWDDCAAGTSIVCPPEEFVPGSGDATDGNYLTPTQVASASATPHLFSGQNIVDQLEAHGLTWKAYMQSMPSAGYQGEYFPGDVTTPSGIVTVKLYAQKHNPFMYFSDINSPGNPRLNNVVPFDGNFQSDLASGNVPNFVWISPDQCHDMHGMSASSAALVGLPSCGYPVSGLDHGAIQLGDQFLQQTVSAITSSQVWRTTNSSIVVVWDEDDYSGFSGCCGSPTGVGGITLGGARVPAIVINSMGRGVPTDSKPMNHYSLLGSIEKLWHLGCLSNTCAIKNSNLMTPMFGH